jgi:predicted methyltransferase
VTANGGTYVAAWPPVAPGNTRAEAFRDRFVARIDALEPASAQLVAFGPDAIDLERAGPVDAILTFRNVHNFMAAGFAEPAFEAFFAALEPGGVLGVVEHRLPADRVQDPRAASGYVQQDYVIALAMEAGFEFVAASEINANPADNADHPFGVWTLPPVGRTSAFGEPANPEFDRAPYDAIGESDRMTLVFRKPQTAPAPGDDE